MKSFLVIVFAALVFSRQAPGQDLSGKWYGRITQGPGGYAGEYALELEIEQRNRRLSGVSFAYYQEDVVARFQFYGYWGGNTAVLQEDLVMEKKTPPPWTVCVKRMELEYTRVDSVEYLAGDWAGIGITDGEACIPGKVYLSKQSPPNTLPAPETRQPADVRQIPDIRQTSGMEPPPAGMPVSETEIPEEVGGTPETGETLQRPAQPGGSGRLLKEGSEIIVTSPRIVIRITDYQILDGDTVTVYFNDEKVVDRKLISKDPIVLHLEVESSRQPSKLLLYAENLGRIPPNTALMIVEDSHGKQQVKLASDYERSDVVYIRYRP